MIKYGSPPKLEHVYRNGQDYSAVLSYTDATDQISGRWVVADLSQLPGGSWYVRAFAAVPLSSEPDQGQVRGILVNSRRCDPRIYAPDGC